jgi:asparagine synthase (glutamine-hydrolysing)
MEQKLNRRQPKYLLRQLAKRVLPSEVLTWPKIGFNSPLGIWLKKEPGRSMLHELLSPESVERRGILQATGVSAFVKEFFNGRRDISLEIWALMFLEAWCREHLEG